MSQLEDLATWFGKQVEYVPVNSKTKGTTWRLRRRGDRLPITEMELRSIVADYCRRYKEITGEDSH